MPIQETYPLTQDRGQVGSNSRPLAPKDADRVITAAAGLRPGYAFKFDGNGKAAVLTNLADSVNAEGIIGFEISEVNQQLAGGTDLTGGIEYAADVDVKYWRQGYIYVTAGGTIAKGAAVGFDPADGKWKAQAGTNMVAAAAAADGEIMEVILRASA